jgi:hypothetical protein
VFNVTFTKANVILINSINGFFKTEFPYVSFEEELTVFMLYIKISDLKRKSSTLFCNQKQQMRTQVCKESRRNLQIRKE